MNSNKKLLTVKEACDAASISRTTLYELCRAGLLQVVKIGPRGIRVPVAELDRFIATQLGETDSSSSSREVT